MSKFEEVAQKEIEQASVTYEAYQGIFKAEVPEEGLVVRSGDEILRFPWLEFAKNWHSDEEFKAEQAARLSVKKLQEQLNTAKKALTEISKTKDFYGSGYDYWEEFSQGALKAQKALAEIGGLDD